MAPPDHAAAYDRLAARLAAAAAATTSDGAATAVRAGAMSTSAMSTSAMGSSPDPRSPDPRDPDATVADLASAAVLGAVLWDPRRLREVMDWLEPDDFLHPVHRAIYATVTGLVAAGEPVNLMRLPAALASGRFHEVHVDPSEPGPLGAAALHTLLAFTPATPPRGGRYDEQPRSEHVRYAQLVLEASVRRQVHAAGVRIAQHAREAIDVVDDSPTPPVYATVAAAVEKLGPVLDTIERHLQHLADRLDHPQATGAGPPGATAAQRDADTTIGTGRVPAELPVPAELHHAELAVLGGCLVAPGLRRTALSILVPADFTTPRVAATWTALTALAARGDPIDFVLLAAAVARHATTTGGVPGLAPAELFRLAERGDPGIGARAVQTVARAALRRAMAAAQHQLAAAAADPTLAAEQVIRDARSSLRRAQATARRLLGEAETTLGEGETTLPRPRSGPAGATPANTATPTNTAAGRPRSVRSSAPPALVPSAPSPMTRTPDRRSRPCGAGHVDQLDGPARRAARARRGRPGRGSSPFSR